MKEPPNGVTPWQIGTPPDQWREAIKNELGELIWLLEEEPDCAANNISDRIRGLNDYMNLIREDLN